MFILLGSKLNILDILLTCISITIGFILSKYNMFDITSDDGALVFHACYVSL